MIFGNRKNPRRAVFAAFSCLVLASAVEARAQWNTAPSGPFTLQSVGIGQVSPAARLWVYTQNQTYGIRVRNLTSQAGNTFGLHASVSGSGTGTRYAVFGSAPEPKNYAGYFEGRGYFGGVPIGVIPSGALVEVADLYPAGGKNLLIGNDAFFTDVDLANVLGLYGNQDSTRAALQLGSAGPYLSGFQGNLGVGVVDPAERLQLGDRFVFHDGGTKVLGANFSFRGGDLRLVQGGVATIRFGNDGGLKFITAPNGPAGSAINYSGTGVFLSPQGLLGIGTDTPTEALEVAGNLKLSGSSVNIIANGDLCIGNCP